MSKQKFDFNVEFEAGHLKRCIFILHEQNQELENQIKILYNFIGNLPKTVSDIEDARNVYETTKR